jgi:GTP-binding protein
VNKWDGLDDYAKDCVRREIDRKLNFLGFAKFHFISALHGKGVGDLFRSIDQAYQAAMVKLSTPRLTRALDVITERQAPPRNGMSRPKMRYAHQGGVNPPVVVIHGSNLVNIPDSYTRYLEHSLCKLFKLEGTPLRVQYKSTDNPYAERKQVSVHPGRRDPVKPGKQFRKK